MCKRNVLTIVAVAILALAIGQVQAETVTVPNGTFHMYKPGTNYTVLGTAPDDIWVQQIGDNRPLSSGTPVSFADGTSGTVVDIPGWITPIESQGSDTGTADLFSLGYDETDGSSCLNCFGAWSGQNGNLAESAESLGNLAAGSNYTLSAMLIGNADPVTFELRAGGVALTPSSSVTPVAPGDWEVISRTYNAADIVAYVGQPMTIVVGTSRPGEGEPALTGSRGRFDNVSLSYVPEEPEPSPDYYQLFNFDDQTVGAPPSIAGFDITSTVVSDAQAYSGNNSWNIEDTSGGTATLDFGWNNDMDFLTEGTWSMSLMMLVPTGTTGVFSFFWEGGGFLVADADADTVHLVAGGTWTAGDTTPLVRDQWVMYEMVFDGGTGVTTHYYNGIELGSDTSSEAGFGHFGGWVDPAIAGGWYIDDIALLQLQ